MKGVANSSDLETNEKKNLGDRNRNESRAGVVIAS